jgi:FKBP-type peptidyl-prolyl cis-trans isomerase
MYSMISRGILIAVVFAAGSVSAAELETEEQKLGYIIGMDVGNSLRKMGTVVDIDALLEAIRTTYEGGEPAISQEEAEAVRQAFIEKRKAAAQAEVDALRDKNQTEGEDFLAENAKKEGVIVTDSGLQYKVLSMGEGPKPSATDTVKVHYRGTLIDGTEFDNSYARNAPIIRGVDEVVAGWTEGMQLMPVGSKFMFFIKPELGYGEDGFGPIPPSATMIFEVELLGIESAE